MLTKETQRGDHENVAEVETTSFHVGGVAACSYGRRCLWSRIGRSSAVVLAQRSGRWGWARVRLLADTVLPNGLSPSENHGDQVTTDMLTEGGHVSRNTGD
jgi:hypothetical protein